MKILYLVLASNEFPYQQLRENGLKNTWLTRLSNNDRVIHLFSKKILGPSDGNRDAFLSPCGAQVSTGRGIESILSQSQDSWTFPTFSGWDSLLHKTLSALNHALETTEFDFVVRTAPTSLWNSKALRNRLSLVNTRNSAFGTVRKFCGKDYIEGSNIIFSRDIALKLVKNVEMFNFGIIDDVSIGNVFSELNISKIDWPRPRIERLWDFHDLRYGEFSQIYTFRCRSSHPYNGKTLSKEIKNMQKLHRQLLHSSNY